MSSYSTNLFSGAVALCTAGAAFVTLSDQETDDNGTNYQMLGSLGIGLATYFITTLALNVRAWMERTPVILRHADPALVPPENRNALIQSRANAEHVVQELAILRAADPALVTPPENRDALIQSRANAEHVVQELAILRAADPALVTPPENRDALIQSGANAEHVARGLATLNAADPALVTPENRAALIQSRANSNHVASGLAILRAADPALVTQENFDALIQSGVHAAHVACGLRALNAADPALVTPENLDALIQSGANSGHVVWGLHTLNATNPALVTQENFDALIRSGANSEHVAWGLRTLNAADPALVTQENFDALIQGGANVEDVTWRLETLNATNPALVTPENRDALIQSEADAEDVAWRLETLNATNPTLVTPENRDALIQSEADAEDVAPEPADLQEAILSRFNELGNIGADEMTLIIGAKQKDEKSYRNSIFVITDLEDFLIDVIKLSTCSTKSKILRFQYVTRINSHSIFGEVILDKSGEKPHLKIFLCDPFCRSVIWTNRIASQLRANLPEPSPLKVTIFAPPETERLQKGLGCSYFSLDGAFMLSNQEQFEDFYGKQLEVSQDFEIIAVPMPVRLKRGSQYFKDGNGILGIESTILSSSENAKKIVNRRETAEESIKKNLKDVGEGKIHNLRIQNKMHKYQQDVKEYLERNEIHIYADLKDAIQPFSQTGFKEYCAKELQ